MSALAGAPRVSVDQNKQIRITYLEKGQVKELNVTDEMNQRPLERMRGPKRGESGEEYRAYRAGKMAEIEAYYPRLSEISKNYPQYDARGAIDLMAHVERHSGNIQSRQPKVNNGNDRAFGIFPNQSRHRKIFPDNPDGTPVEKDYKRPKLEDQERQYDRAWAFKDNGKEITAEKPALATVPDDSLVMPKPDSGLKVT